MGRIEAEWQKYLKQVVPQDAGPAQVQGSRFAFYAGATSLFGILMNVLDPGAEPTHADLRAVDELHEEIQGHLSEVIAQGEVS